jgi:hypothetical protein
VRLIALLLIACQGKAPPPPTLVVAPDAQPLVDAWLAALGGRELAYHVKGDGDELWISPHGGVREVVEHDGVHEVRVFDGTRAWIVDDDGESRELSPREGQELRYQAVLYGGPFTDRVATISKGGADALDIKLVTGALRVWLDPSTHLPVASGATTEPRAKALRIEYRPVDGTPAAYAFARGSDREELAVDRAEPTEGFAQPTEHAHDVSGAKLPVVIPVSISTEGLAYTNVRLNGTVHPLMIDSGSPDISIAQSDIRELGLDMFGDRVDDGSDRKLHTKYARGLTLGVGDVTIAPHVVSAVDIGDLAWKFSSGLEGMLGYSFLSRFVVTLDYRAGTMTLDDPDTYAHPAGTPIPLTFDHNTPYVDATLALPGGATVIGHFVFDTGCGCTFSLNAPFEAAHPDARHATRLAIGDAVIEAPRAISPGSGPAAKRADFDGQLGARFGDTYRIVLDYRHQRIWLDPL